VTVPSAGLVQVLSLQTRKLTRSLDVGGDPRPIGFSQQGHHVAVTHPAGYISLTR
jgi:hypothetical protein